MMLHNRSSTNGFGIALAPGHAMPISVDAKSHFVRRSKLEFVQNKTVNITGSSNVVVGDNNQITLTQYVAELAQLIDNSSGTSEQKTEAKSILQSFLEHPLVTAIAGGIAGGAIELLRGR